MRSSVLTLVSFVLTIFVPCITPQSLEQKNTDNNSGHLCKEFLADDKVQGEMTSWRNKATPCPCQEKIISLDYTFKRTESGDLSKTGTGSCYEEWFPNEDGVTQMCCYRTDGTLRTGPNGGGYVIPNNTSYNITDVYSNCCQGDHELCHQFYEINPSDDCSRYVTPFSARSYGDPQITTLDGHKYSFNGHGEYVFLNTSDIQIQARTEYVIVGNKDVTMFTAFVFHNEKKKISIETHFNRTSNVIQVYNNGMLLCNSSNTRTAPCRSTGYCLMIIAGGDKVIIFDTGRCGIKSFAKQITLTAGAMMDITFDNVHKDALNSSMQGLVGVTFNDSYVLRNKSTVPLNSTEGVIFDFGETWQLKNPSKSLFNYNLTGGHDYAFYNSNHTRPRFLEDLVGNLTELFKNFTYEDITKFDETCRNYWDHQPNTECLLAIAKNNDYSFGVNVMKKVNDTRRIYEITHNTAPFFHKNLSIIDVVPHSDNKSITIDLSKYVSDNESTSGLNFTIDSEIPTSDFAISYEGVFIWNFTDLLRNINLTRLNIIVTDEYDKNAKYSMYVRYCGCEHGLSECPDDFLETVPSDKDHIIKGTCSCITGFEGTYCQIRQDPCLITKCYKNRCNSSVAIEEDPCLPCPKGYNGDGRMCTDLNECDDKYNGTDKCTQNCNNTDGSFTCGCNGGYRLNKDNFTCDDIDECEEGPKKCSARQNELCVNTLGSATCNCMPNFMRKSENGPCEPIGDGAMFVGSISFQITITKTYEDLNKTVDTNDHRNEVQTKLHCMFNKTEGFMSVEVFKLSIVLTPGSSRSTYPGTLHADYLVHWKNDTDTAGDVDRSLRDSVIAFNNDNANDTFQLADVGDVDTNSCTTKNNNDCLCNKFLSDDEVHGQMTSWRNKATPCPCQEKIMSLDYTFKHTGSGDLNKTGTGSCYEEWFPNEDGVKQMCCYRTDGTLRTGPNGGGYVIPNNTSYNITDVYSNCCQGDHELCHQFYEINPSDDCSRYVTPFSARSYGDPLITTLDGHKYSFNGHGEYVFLNTSDIQIQARTEYVVEGNIDATMFTAFVFHNEKKGISIETHFNRTSNVIQVYNNGMLLCNSSNTRTAPCNSTGYCLMIIAGGDKVIIVDTRKCGIESFAKQITLTAGAMMDITFDNVHKDALNSSMQGLAGVTFNDSYVLRSKSTVPLNSTEGVIFDFGETWQLQDPSESLFNYSLTGGRDYAFYNSNHTRPRFLEDLVGNLNELFKNSTDEDITKFNETCRNYWNHQPNTECLLAIARNSNYSFGVNVMKKVNDTRRIYEITHNTAPFFHKNLSVIDVVPHSDNKSITIDLSKYVSDNESTSGLNFTIDSEIPTRDFAISDEGLFIWNFTDSLRNINLTRLNIIVTDEYEKVAKYSMYVRYCGCEHGLSECPDNFLKTDPSGEGHIIKGTCSCITGFEGTFCQNKNDPCLITKCYKNRCNSSVAIEEDPCLPCPKGFDGDGRMCTDVDECDDKYNGTDKCTQTCYNTDGSFKCDCNEGYRLNKDNFTCDDIDECKEGTKKCSARQHELCVNTLGSATCNCMPNFMRKSENGPCEEIGDGAMFVGSISFQITITKTDVDLNKTVDTLEHRNEVQTKLHYMFNKTEGFLSVEVFKLSIVVTRGSSSRRKRSTDPGTLYADYLVHWKNDTDTADDVGRSLRDSVIVFRNEIADDKFQLADIADVDPKSASTEINNGTDTGVCQVPKKSDCDTLSTDCINTNGGFQCSCKAGFKVVELSPKYCTDINECSEGDVTEGRCIDGTCLNQVGSWNCTCPSDKTWQNVGNETYPMYRCQGNYSYIGYTNLTWKGTNDTDEIKSEIQNEVIHLFRQSDIMDTDGTLISDLMVTAKVVEFKKTSFSDDSMQVTANYTIQMGQIVNISYIDDVLSSKKNIVDKNATFSTFLVYNESDNKLCELTNNGGCDTDSTACKQINGSTTCKCKDGFEKNSDSAKFCSDINECSEGDVTEADRCIDGTCLNQVGSWNCTCPFDKTWQNVVNETYPMYRCQGNYSYIGYTKLIWEGTNDTDEIKSEIQNEVIHLFRQSEIMDTDGTLISDLMVTATVVELNKTSSSDSSKLQVTANYTIQMGQIVNISYIEDVLSSNKNITNKIATFLTFLVYKESDNKLCELTNNGGCDTDSTSCKQINGSTTCKCKDGFEKNSDSAKFCSDIDECKKLNNTCSGHGNCTNKHYGFSCACDEGFKENTSNPLDVRCEDIDECNSDQYECIDGSCNNTDGNWTCSCNTGYIWKRINDYTVQCIDIDECSNTSYHCDGKCSNTKGSWDCTCHAGYKRHENSNMNMNITCVDIDECKDNITRCIGGYCLNTVGSWSCGCNMTSYLPIKKTNDTYRCMGNYSYIGYTKLIWEGTNDTDEIKSEIQNEVIHLFRQSDIMDTDGTLISDLMVTAKVVEFKKTSSSDSSKLQGTANYTIQMGQIVNISYIEDVLSSNKNITNKIATFLTFLVYKESDNKLCELTNNGGCDTDSTTCKQINGSTTCICKDGFEKNSDSAKFCSDIDECKKLNKTCSGHGNCTNKHYGFSCACDEGFKENTSNPLDVRCEDIDECNSDQYECIDGSCNNTDGNWTCSCNTGYIWKRINDYTVQCIDIDECSNTSYHCDGKCSNTKGSWDCTCHAGYKRHENSNMNMNITCVDIDECKDNITRCIGGYCLNTVGSWSCGCNMTSYLPIKKTNDTYRCMGNYSYIGYTKLIWEGTNDTDEIKSEIQNEVINLFRQSNITDTDGTLISDLMVTATVVEFNKTSSTGDSMQVTANYTIQMGKIVNINYIDNVLSSKHFVNKNATFSTFVVYNESDNKLCELTNNGGCDTDTTTCKQINGSTTCNCKDGFDKNSDSAKFCSDINECNVYENKTCSGLGKCNNKHYGFSCECNKGYKENATNPLNVTCEDIDECKTDLYKCMDGACNNTDGDWTCSCNGTGYIWTKINDYTVQCIDIDECSNSSYYCGGKCANTKGSWNCTCPAGYKRSENNNMNITCVDINECNDTTTRCIGGYCINSIGNWSCRCNNTSYYPHKKTQDSYRCMGDFQYVGEMKFTTFDNISSSVIIDIFNTNVTKLFGSKNNSVQLSTKNVGMSDIFRSLELVNNSINSSYVAPVKSFFLKFILHIGEPVAAFAVNSTYAVSTTLKPSFYDIQVRLETVLFSESGYNLCDVEGKTKCHLDSTDCLVHNGSYTCDCKDGFEKTSDPYTCDNIDECRDNSRYHCTNGGTCKDSIGNWSCVCPTGFTEERINQSYINCTDINECNDNQYTCDGPTNTSAKCINTIGSWQCNCASGFKLGRNGTHTKTCEDIDECSNSSYYCGGKCANTKGSWNCTCPAGYERSENNNMNITCVDINECNDTTTRCIGGYCINSIGNWSCRCNNTSYYPYKKTQDSYRCMGDFQYVGEMKFTTIHNISSSVIIDIFNTNVTKLFGSKNNSVQLSTISVSMSDIFRSLELVNNSLNSSYVAPVKSFFLKFILHIGEPVAAFAVNSTYAVSTTLKPSFYDIQVRLETVLFSESGYNLCDVEGKTKCHLDSTDCLVHNGSYTCDCKDGFEKTSDPYTCDNIDECRDNSRYHCTNGGTCKDSIGNWSCVCPTGFTEERINQSYINCTDINECDDNQYTCDGPTNTAAKCINTIGSWQCNCASGFKLGRNGTHTKTCEDIDECVERNPCVNGSTCQNHPGNYSCSCERGYNRIKYHNGIYGCEDIDECKADNACIRSLHCENIPGDWLCTCGHGLEVMKLNASTKICGGGYQYVAEIIFNVIGSVSDVYTYNDYLEPKLQGLYREVYNDQLIQIDLLSTKERPQLPGVDGRRYVTKYIIQYAVKMNASDLQLIENFYRNNTCPLTCLPDTIGKNNVVFGGITIYNNSEICDTPRNVCNEAVSTCVSNEGQLDCECKNGYMKTTNNSFQCEDIDECHDNRFQCSGSGICNNIPGSWSCDCNPGYKFFENSEDNFTCKDINECDDNQYTCNGPTNTSAKCNNTIGSWQCNCASGFKTAINGTHTKTCEDVDECAEQIPCVNGSTCHNHPGNYSCSCERGYNLINHPNGTYGCEDINECDDNQYTCDGPTNTSAKCNNTIGSWQCNCASGFKLAINETHTKTCEDIDECVERKPCVIGSTCHNHLGNYSCSCEHGYNLVNNSHDDKYGCQDINECKADNACIRSLHCENLPGDWMCTCGDGLEAKKLNASTKICEDIDECDDNRFQCSGGSAICNNTPGSWSCDCKPGYKLFENSKDNFTCKGDVYTYPFSLSLTISGPDLNKSVIKLSLQTQLEDQYRISLNDNDLWIEIFDIIIDNSARRRRAIGSKVGVKYIVHTAQNKSTDQLKTVFNDTKNSFKIPNYITTLEAQPESIPRKDMCTKCDTNSTLCNYNSTYFSCDCKKGFKRISSNDENSCFDPCTESKCYKSSICTRFDNEDGYKCGCAKGSTGIYCETEIETVDKNNASSDDKTILIATGSSLGGLVVILVIVMIVVCRWRAAKIKEAEKISMGHLENSRFGGFDNEYLTEQYMPNHRNGSISSQRMSNGFTRNGHIPNGTSRSYEHRGLNVDRPSPMTRPSYHNSLPDVAGNRYVDSSQPFSYNVYSPPPALNRPRSHHDNRDNPNQGRRSPVPDYDAPRSPKPDYKHRDASYDSKDSGVGNGYHSNGYIIDTDFHRGKPVSRTNRTDRGMSTNF